MDNLHQSYPSVSALRELADNGDWRFAKNKSLVASFMTRSDDPDWFGIRGGASAVLRALTDGYPAGEALLTSFRSEIAHSIPKAIGFRRTLRRGDAGDTLDIHAVNQGDLSRAWTSAKRQARRGSGSVRVVIDIGGNANVSAETLQWRGVAGLTLSDALTQAGYAIEIVAAHGVRRLYIGQSAPASVSITVKSRGASTNVGLLAATVTLPGFFRTLGFIALVRLADSNGAIAAGNLGHTVEVSKCLPAQGQTAQFIVPANVTSKASAIDWVKQSITLIQGAPCE